MKNGVVEADVVKSESKTFLKTDSPIETSLVKLENCRWLLQNVITNQRMWRNWQTR